MEIKTCSKCGKPRICQEERKGDICRECIDAGGEEVRRVIRLFHPTWVKSFKEIGAMLGLSDKTIAYHNSIIQAEDRVRYSQLRAKTA